MNHCLKNFAFIFLSFILVFSSCRRQTMKLRSSVRRTQNDARYFNRDVNNVKNLLGIQGDENKSNNDSLASNIYTHIDQKNIFTSYGYIYDAING